MRISDWSSDVCSSDLPAILAPAAHAFLATIADDRVPIAIGLLLIVGQNHEAHRLVGLEMRAAVQADERLAAHGELHRQSSKERREGNEGVSTCRTRWSPYK